MVTREPQAILNDFVTPEDTRADLNALENFIDEFGGGLDTYQRAQIRNQSLQGEMLGALVDALGGTRPGARNGGDGGGGDGDSDGDGGSDMPSATSELLRRLINSELEVDDLPAGIEGSPIQSIGKGKKGQAEFDVLGSSFITEVTASSQVQPRDTVRVIGRGDTANLIDSVPNRQAAGDPTVPVERAIRFDESPGANNDILRNDIRPFTEGSQLIATVSLGASAVFKARIKPDDDDIDNFDQEFNGAAATQEIDANEVFEFQLHKGPGVEVNYRVDTDVTVQELRVLEVTAR